MIYVYRTQPSLSRFVHRLPSFSPQTRAVRDEKSSEEITDIRTRESVRVKGKELAAVHSFLCSASERRQAKTLIPIINQLDIDI